jgi:hypothetical protein
MTRKFFTLVLIVAMSIAAGSMACIQTINDLDSADETDSGT